MTVEKIHKFKNNLDTVSFESIFSIEKDELELIDTEIKIDFSGFKFDSMILECQSY